MSSAKIVELANEVELRVADALADPTMNTTALKTTDIWNAAPHLEPDAPLRIWLA